MAEILPSALEKKAGPSFDHPDQPDHPRAEESWNKSQMLIQLGLKAAPG